jgi:hypothetical protein
MKKHVLRWIIIGILTIFTAFSLVSCGKEDNNDKKETREEDEDDFWAEDSDKEDSDTEEATPEEDEEEEDDAKDKKKVAEKDSGDKEYIDESDLDAFFLDPDQFKGKYIKLSGKVTSELEKGEDKYYLTAYHDVENFEKQFNVAIDEAQEISTDEFFIIEGRIEGATQQMEDIYLTEDIPLISAKTVKATSYMEAFAPAEKTIEPKMPVDQYGFVVTIDKIEFSKKETRLYITAANNSATNCSLYEFNSKVVQNGQQFESADAGYDSNYPELPDEILPGVSASGIFVFPPLDSGTEFDITMEGYSSNYEEDFAPYTYKITP